MASAWGRPSLPPGVYVRLLLIGYFEGIDSERGIAWRVADSLTLREFLGLSLSEAPPDHSMSSRTQRLIDVETHQEVFAWVLTILGKEDLLRGKTIGVDATTLEANAAMKSIVRRDAGESYKDFLCRLAEESGEATPIRAELARKDKKRKGKGSNDDWANPHDPDAKITKMKDSRTHLAHKAEQAVDLETGAVVAVTVQPADRGDTQSLEATLRETLENNLAVVVEQVELPEQVLTEVVADRGYHSAAVLARTHELGLRSYIAEPKRPRRRWRGRQAEQKATYASLRRMRGSRAETLARWRAEKVEGSMAHNYETGGLRRIHLRGQSNILKRVLVHVAGFNLDLVMQKVAGYGTPRGLQGRFLMLLAVIFSTFRAFLWRSNSVSQPAQPHAPARQGLFSLGRLSEGFGRLETMGVRCGGGLPWGNVIPCAERRSACPRKDCRRPLIRQPFASFLISYSAIQTGEFRARPRTCCGC